MLVMLRSHRTGDFTLSNNFIMRILYTVIIEHTGSYDNKL